MAAIAPGILRQLGIGAYAECMFSGIVPANNGFMLTWSEDSLQNILLLVPVELFP